MYIKVNLITQVNHRGWVNCESCSLQLELKFHLAVLFDWLEMAFEPFQPQLLPNWRHLKSFDSLIPMSIWIHVLHIHLLFQPNSMNMLGQFQMDVNGWCCRNLVVALKELSIRGDFGTTVEYLIKLLETEEYQTNNITTGWLDRLIAEKVKAERPDTMLAVICCALHIADHRILTSFSDFTTSLERWFIHILVEVSGPEWCISSMIYIVEIHHSGWEPSWSHKPCTHFVWLIIQGRQVAHGWFCYNKAAIQTVVKWFLSNLALVVMNLISFVPVVVTLIPIQGHRGVKTCLHFLFCKAIYGSRKKWHAVCSFWSDEYRALFSWKKSLYER